MPLFICTTHSQAASTYRCQFCCNMKLPISPCVLWCCLRWLCGLRLWCCDCCVHVLNVRPRRPQSTESVEVIDLISDTEGQGSSSSTSRRDLDRGRVPPRQTLRMQPYTQHSSGNRRMSSNNPETRNVVGSKFAHNTECIQ